MYVCMYALSVIVCNNRLYTCAWSMDRWMEMDACMCMCMYVSVSIVQSTTKTQREFERKGNLDLAHEQITQLMQQLRLSMQNIQVCMYVCM